MNSASSSRLTRTATTATRARSSRTRATVSSASAVCAAVGDARPAEPGAAQQAGHGRAAPADGRWPALRGVAVEDDGEARAAAAAREADLRRGRGRLLARADDGGDAGLARTRSCRRASCAGRPAMPGASRSTSVGDTIPGAKPRLAASSARRTSLPAGSARTRLSPSLVEPTWVAAKVSSPMAISAIGIATGRDEATRETTRRQRGSGAHGPARRCAAWPPPGASGAAAAGRWTSADRRSRRRARAAPPRAYGRTAAGRTARRARGPA